MKFCSCSSFLCCHDFQTHCRGLTLFNIISSPKATLRPREERPRPERQRNDVENRAGRGAGRAGLRAHQLGLFRGTHPAPASRLARTHTHRVLLQCPTLRARFGGAGRPAARAAHRGPGPPVLAVPDGTRLPRLADTHTARRRTGVSAPAAALCESAERDADADERHGACCRGGEAHLHAGDARQGHESPHLFAGS